MHERTVGTAMRRIFFRNNLFAFLALLVLPILIMGSLSMYLLHGYIRKNLDKETEILLDQLVSKVDLITDQFNPLIRTVDIEGQSSYVARKLLDSVEMTYTDIFLLNDVKDQLASLRNAREYIHSINLYFVNSNDYYLSDTGKHSLSEDDGYWFDSYQENRYRTQSWTLVSEHRQLGGSSYTLLSMFHVLGNGEGVIVFNLRPDYLTTLITEGLAEAGHQLCITDEEGQILLGSLLPGADGERYIISTALSENTRWTLTLYSDKAVIFRVYRNVLFLILAFSTLSLVVGVILSVWLTQRRTRQIYAIINLLEAAQHNEKLPKLPEKQGPTYGYIIHQIVNAFLEHSYVKAQLEARKYKLKTAQLVVLQAQLNPHFLFNTLETLNWKVYEFTNSANQANQMIENLSDLMRYSLGSSEDMVSLSDEVENIKSYLSLQKVRYQEKFETHYDIEKGALHCRMPRMLLQPIVENAIYHGIKPLERNGLIMITAKQENSSLLISIFDDGVGMTESQKATLLASLDEDQPLHTDHIGLANVQARLRLLYGQSIAIESQPNEGTTIYIQVPQDGEAKI